MNDELLKTVEIIRQIKNASKIKTKRNFMDFFSDRIRQAVTEVTLLKAIERLCNLTSVEITYIGKDRMLNFIKAASLPRSNDILNWLREYPNIAAMIAFMDGNDARDAVEQIEMSVSKKKTPGTAILRKAFDINVVATCTTPLAHGGDTKAGNASLFRRMDVLSDTNYVLNLPYYAGNAIRGQVRDLLADHFLRALDIMPNKSRPPIELWFFHCLYAGGALEEVSKSTAAISKIAGNTAQKAGGIKLIRDMMPALSLLGFAVGNRILSGRCSFGDWRPACKEWGYPDVNVSAGDLIEWVFLTRREDHEGHDNDKNSSMIASTECLKIGTELRGGINISSHAIDVEKGALAKGLMLLQEIGHIGAENRRDLGGIKVEFEGLPDTVPYESFLIENKQDIIDFLKLIKAIAC
ncbi:hypothetical protein KAR91_74815 [Candidatus Pacearchaeota archaeon]|nr:hypothetical protein [Candidatus Pacearchaeota archaeon]